ncbi:MAG: hypothetical protein GF330_06540 [Candidatus Eisenbacteria bacterium]|nr:hypothetical protein [Candidatus Eisenbacteria bacterium]
MCARSSEPHRSEPRFARDVRRKQARKLRARRQRSRSLWFGLGMFGLVGWAVAVPTLIGVAAGIWLDARDVGGPLSWTLTLLIVGVALGCINAWYWVRRERAEIFRKSAGDDDD